MNILKTVFVIAIVAALAMGTYHHLAMAKHSANGGKGGAAQTSTSNQNGPGSGGSGLDGIGGSPTGNSCVDCASG